MNTNKPALVYGTYRRKSQESEERQILSLEDQERDIEAAAKRGGLKIALRFPGESKSAYKRGRPIFGEMMEAVESGKINAILVWHPNRLARNAFDGGWLITAMDEGKLLAISTPSRTYGCSSDDKFFLQLEFGMAKKSSDDSSEAVKRGLKSKLEDGWMPGSAPLGYENTKLATRGANTIVKDKERFPLLRKAWELMLTGNYMPDEILDLLNNEWGFRTRPWKKRGGKPMSRSTIYKIFTNPFYAGLIDYQLGGSRNTDAKDRVLRPGKHEPLVTMDEFDKVQIILGRAGKRRPTRYSYAYNGIINCGECGGFVSATYKEKVLGTGELRQYVLYYCVTARKHPERCSQSMYTRAEVIEQEIEHLLMGISIPETLRDWAIEILTEQGQNEAVVMSEIADTRQKTVNAVKRQMENLLSLRLQDLIEDSDFTSKSTELKNELARLEVQDAEVTTEDQNWIKLTADAFELAYYAHKAFQTGDAQVRREILSAVGLNRRLYDGTFRFQAVDWLIPLAETAPSLRAEIEAFEPAKYGTDEWRKTAFAAFRPQVRSRRDLNPQPPA